MKPGDRVVHVRGGPAMTVAGCSETRAFCQWRDADGRLWASVFPVAELTTVEEPQPA